MRRRRRPNSLRFSCRMFKPSNSMRPLVGSIRRSTMRPMVVLPQPDSPTRPKLSPRRTAKDTPETAFTQAVGWARIPPPKGKCLTSSVTCSRGVSAIATPPFRKFLQPAPRPLARLDAEKIRRFLATQVEGVRAAFGKLAPGDGRGDRRNDSGDFPEPPAAAGRAATQPRHGAQ